MISSSDPAAVLTDAQAAASEGDIERAATLLCSIRGSALNEQDRTLACLLLAECGLLHEAREAAEAIRDEGARDRLRSVLESPAAPPNQSLLPLADEPDEETEMGALVRSEPADEVIVDQFLRWFGGRRDIYARQWFDEHRHRSGYHPVHEPLTASVVRQHLEGRITIGQYLLFPDATAAFGVIDLDLSASSLEALRASRGEDASPLDHDGLRSYTKRLLEVGSGLGLPLTAESSGGRGIHVWLFLAPRRKARAVRELLSQVLIGAGAQPPDVSAEIFPKQDSLGPRGLSSLVKLPFGIHQISMKRCLLLDRGFQPIEDARIALSQLTFADPVLVEALLARRILPLPAPELEASGSLPALPAVGSPRSIAEALRQIEGEQETRRGVDRMLEGCNVIRELVNKAYAARRLEPAEARAIIYTIGLVGRDPSIAREILAVAGASQRELERARRGVPAPIGCSKLRRLAPNQAECHGCPSAQEARPYATPALFAVGARDPARPRHAPFAPWIGEDCAISDPLEAVGESLRRIEARLDRIETQRESAGGRAELDPKAD